MKGFQTSGSFLNITSLFLMLGSSVLAAGFPPHPFLLINPNELSVVRREIARPGWKQTLYHARPGDDLLGSKGGLRSNADLWLRREIKIPARGGHYHHFFCEDGERLIVPEGKQFQPGPYRCPKCGREYAGEKYEAALRCMAHHWLAVAARDLALAAKLEGKRNYSEKAAEILGKYAEAYPGPHTSNLEGGMLFQSLNEAMWIIPLAQAYDLVHEDLTPTEQKRISHFLQVAGEGIRRCGVRGNWGSWHLSAVGVVGYAIGNEEMIAWATEEFKRQIRDELGDDGLWPESVHCYHYFPLAAFVDFAEAAWRAGTDLYHWEAKPGKSLLSMFTAPLAYAYPDLRLPAINDGWFEAFVPGDFYEIAACRDKNPRFLWVLANAYHRQARPGDVSRDGLRAFLFGKKIPKRIASPDFKSVNFPVLGICALRSTHDAMMTFDYGPFLGHGQNDKMGVTLFAHGKLRAADYGTPGYGSAILPWYKSTFSHNTIVVDGKNQNATQENNAKLWLDGGDLEAAQSTTEQAYPGVTHSRTVIRIRDYFVVADRLASTSEHTYDFYFHAEGRFTFDQSPKAVGAPKPGAVGAAERWIKDLQVYPPEKTFSGTWREKASGLAFWISGDEPLTPMTAQCPTETGTRLVPLLIARQTGKTAAFVTVLAPFSAGKAALRVEKRGADLLIRNGKTKDVLTIPPTGGKPILTVDP